MHHNPLNARVCELCEWTIGDESTDETQCAVDPPKPPDNDVTIAPKNHNEPGLPDPDATVAPNSLVANPVKSEEQRTFHLAGDLAHFEIIEILGQGGMGAVYHAKDLTLQRDVALKMMRSVNQASQVKTAALLDEARMASKLNHPNIVTIYDVARTDNSNYIVMEWVDGQSMDQVIPPNGLSLTEALNYACQIADGLVAAHQKYLIHRDIKPQNIMLTKDNTIKILDFGIAGLVSHISESSSKVHQESARPTVIGTPSYMSPEQVKGLNLDQRSDIFSFGIVLYQMLSGTRPFTAGPSKSVTEVICQGEYIPIQNWQPDTPPRVIHLLEKMLATQQDERWQSSAELAAELHDIYQEMTHVKNWWQRRHWLIQALLVLPFVLALGWAVKEVMFPATTQQLIERQLAEAQKIAILPLENISGDPTLQLFGDGLAVNLSTDLALVASELGDTWIVPATEISRMKEVTPKAVADKYGVELILTGSMQHMGSTRLVVLNLLDAQSGQQLKTSELIINADDLFGGHTLIREQAMALLDWPLSESFVNSFNAERPVLDGAYKHYVEGRGYLYRFDQPGNADNALLAFEEAINTDGKYQNAYFGLAETQLRKYIKTSESDWLEKAEETVNTLSKLSDDNKGISFLKAEIAYQRGNYNEAVNLYEKNLNANKNHVASKIGLANALKQSGEKDKAEKVFIETIENHPNNWRVVSGFGIYYFQVGNYQGALEQFRQLSLMSPNNDLGVRNMAAAYYALGNIDQAIKYTIQAIQINPSDRAYSNLGTMYFYEKDYQKSIEAYLKAIEFNQDSYLTWGNLADAYKLIRSQEDINAYHKAAKLAEKSIQINPNNSASIAHLAYYYANLNDRKGSMIQASKIGSNHSGLENFTVATAYDILNDEEKTITHLQYAIDNNYPIEEIKNTPLLVNIKKSDKYKRLLN